MHDVVVSDPKAKSCEYGEVLHYCVGKNVADAVLVQEAVQIVEQTKETREGTVFGSKHESGRQTYGSSKQRMIVIESVHLRIGLEEIGLLELR